MKRIFSFVVAACVFLALQAAVSAEGFVHDGGYTSSKTGFGFETGDTVLVYNGELYEEPDFEEVWPGSSIYIPLYILGESSGGSQASDKDIKNNEVAVSWKATRGARYIDDISLINGKKDKVDGLAGAIYAKISVNKDYTGSLHTPVEVSMSLSVKKISYPETQTTLDMSLINREVEIDRDMVYAALSPTQFYALKQYGGAATFDFGDKIRYTATVEKGTKYYLHLDRSESPSVREQYPGAYMEFYNFLGDKDTFASAGKLEIPINRSKFTPKGQTKARVFVYEVSGSNLKALDERVLSFDGRKNLLTINTKTLNNYVLSDSPLSRQVESAEDNIIYTGYDTGSTDRQDAGTPPSSSGSQSTDQSGAVNYNPDMGGDNIYADNPSAHNPSTSDGRLCLYLIPIGLASGLSALVMWKKGYAFLSGGRPFWRKA